MIRWQLALLLLAAGLISIWLMVKVVTSDRSRLDKFGAILLLAVPFVGPLLYWFVYNDLPPQHPRLQNRGPRGEYASKWRSIRPVLEDGLASRQDGEDRYDQGGRPRP
jgi:hypothetical protein